MNALILARGGSKGVPMKNIKKINGKPLLFYPIDAAKKTKLINKIFVSTDNEEIADVARSFGAEVINRPAKLAQDNSTDFESFKHFCKITKLYNPIIHLRATTPILNPKIIDKAIIEFYKNEKKITSLRSVHETSESVYKCFTIKNKNLQPIVENIDPNNPRQTYKKTYSANGYIDIVNPKTWKNKTFYGNNIYPFLTKFSPEIDNIDDFNYIEYLMSKDV